jgi:ABC-type lipoprotein release transport system permease subunit
MLELMLSRYLIKPLFSILLGLGAIIGVICLLVVLSLFQNYFLASEKVFMSIHPHIQIHKEMTADEGEKIITQLKNAFPEMTDAEPALYLPTRIIISKADIIEAACVNKQNQSFCLDMKNYPQDDTELDIVVKEGFNLSEKKDEKVLIKGITVADNETVMAIKRIINGSSNLERLSQTQDSNGFTLPYGFYMEQSFFNEISGAFLVSFPEVSDKLNHFRLNGGLKLGTKRGKLPLLIMSIDILQELINKPNQLNTIEIKLAKPYDSEKMAKAIQDRLGSEFQITSWIKKEKAAFAFLNIVKLMIFLIIFSISIVAAISVYSTLSLAVIENRKKISILKALGIKDSSIYLIFISNALTIGMVGVVVGGILGYLSSHYFIIYFGENLRALGIENPEIQLTQGDILLTASATLLLFLITAIVPARNAIKMDAVDNLRH